MIQKKVNLFRIIPLIIFFSLILLAFIALKSYDKDNIPSVLIGQSPPPLLLEELGNLKLLDKRDLKPIKENKIRLINFWASWCPPCRVEHPQLEKLSKNKNIQLFGVNYKDSENSALNFLNEYGNPFLKIGSDKNGRNAIEWGVYGVPETFVIDQHGNVLFRHAGPITKAILEKNLVHLLNRKQIFLKILLIRIFIK